jgi:hypothetical protein
MNNSDIPKLHILGLKWDDSESTMFKRGNIPPVNIMGYTLSKHESHLYTAPAISQNGEVTHLILGDTLEGLKNIQLNISQRFADQLRNIHNWNSITSIGLTNFIVIGFSIMKKDKINKYFFIYETLFTPVPIPELFPIYSRLQLLKGTGDDSNIYNYFSSNPQMEWINTLIVSLENVVNWPLFSTESINKITNIVGVDNGK